MRHLLSEASLRSIGIQDFAAIRIEVSFPKATEAGSPMLLLNFSSSHIESAKYSDSQTHGFAGEP